MISRKIELGLDFEYTPLNFIKEYISLFTAKKGETIELGINHAYSSNPKIFIDPERGPINIGNLPCNFDLTFFEEKGDWEAPWAHHRRFTLEFTLTNQG